MRAILLCLILLPLSQKAQSVSDLDNKFGYKDLRFDMPFDTIVRMTKAKKSFIQTPYFAVYDFSIAKYKKFAEFTGDADVVIYKKDSSIYCFQLLMDTRGIEEYKRLAAFFYSLYGIPTSTDNIYNVYKWIGSKVDMTLRYNSELNNTQIEIVNIETENKVSADLKKKMEIDKQDF